MIQSYEDTVARNLREVRENLEAALWYNRVTMVFSASACVVSLIAIAVRLMRS
jgi:hypothetical protein